MPYTILERLRERRDLFAGVSAWIDQVVGIGGAAAGAKLLTSYLFGVHALEPVVLALTALMLALIGAVAAFAPLRRALAVQPMDALRHE